MEGTSGAFTVTAILFEVVEEDVAQLALLVSTQVTRSLFASMLLLKVAAFTAVFVPFIFHWYAGVMPPLTGVAVKVILVPWQIEVADAEMLTAGVIEGVTLSVILVEVAVAGVAHGALLVNTTLTELPSVKVLLV